MHLGTLGPGALLALAANAIMIPSTLSVKGDALGPHVSKHHVLKASCPTCSFDVKNGDAESDLVHTLDIDQEANQFLLDKAVIFPPNSIPATMHVQQVPSGEDAETFLVENPNLPGLRVTDYAIVVDDQETGSENGIELIMMTVLIHRIQNQRVHQTIRVALAKDGEGKLSIVNSILDEAKYPVESDCHGPVILCKWREVLIARIRKMKTALKKHKSRPCGRPGRLHTARPHHYNRPHHDGQHPRHKVHPFVKFLIVPIIGFALGVGVYFVGWAVGTSVAFIYLFFFRGRRATYRRISLEDDDIETPGAEHADSFPKDSKDLYLVEDAAEVEGEAPPVYVEEVAGKEGKK